MAAFWDYDLAVVNSDGDAYDFVLELTEMGEDTDYECQFLLCSTDMLFPTCQDYGSAAATVKTDSTSFAGYLTGGLVILFALIFN